MARALLPAMGRGNLKTHDFGKAGASFFANALDYTERVMAKPKPKTKSSMEALADSFSELVEDARKRMPPEQFRRAEKEFDEIVGKAKARASRDGRRETA